MKFVSNRRFSSALFASCIAAGSVVGFAACSSDKAAKPTPCPATVDLTIDAKSGYRFSEKEITAKAGQWSVKLVNKDSQAHNFEIHGADGTALVKSSGDEACAIFTLTKGEYTFFCGISGHETSGMKGKLTVS